MSPYEIAAGTGVLVIVGRWARQAIAPPVTKGNKDANAVSFKLIGAAIFYVLMIAFIDLWSDQLASAFATLVFVTAFLEFAVPIAQGLGLVKA